MADGFHIEIDAELAEQLKGVAEAAGVDPHAYALDVLKSALAADWAEDIRRLEEYDRTGESVPLEQGIAEFRKAIEDGLRSRR